MAKVKGPLFSLDAKGPIGKIFYYQGGKCGTTARRLPRQPEIVDAYQLQKQLWYAEAVAHWHLLTGDEQDLWRAYADERGNEGYHAFISQYLRHLIAGTDPWKLPDGTLWEEQGKKAIAGIAISGIMIYGYIG